MKKRAFSFAWLLTSILSLAFFINQTLATDEWLARAGATGIPGRAVHTAVWTGEEMLVWGGEGSGVSYDSGARFLAKSNIWTVMSTVNAPVHRSGHTAVWTGTEMILWGGYNGAVLNTGGRYNPKTDTWTPTSTVGAPSARVASLVLWTGSEVIVWSGTGTGSTLFGDGALYNPETDTWRAMSQVGAPSARGGVCAVWTGTEMIVWGGNDNTNTLGDGAVYNPQTDTWRPITSVNAPSARTWIIAPVWTGTEMIVWGGATRDFSATFGDGAKYNPTTDTWTAISSVGAPAGRNRSAMAWTGKEMVVFGGATGKFSNTYVNTGGRYNPTTDTWTATTTTGAPGVRIHHSAVWTGASVLIYGGFTGSGHASDCTSYSPEFGFQTVTGDWLTQYFGSDYRHNPAALESVDADGDGFTNVSEFQAESDPTSAESIPALGEWLQRADNSVVPARSIYASAWTGKELLIWGGESIGVSYGNGARYSPHDNQWTRMSDVNSPVNRSQHASVWTGTEFMVWGGYNGTQLNSGGLYNPQTDTWQAISLDGALTPRSHPAMVWTGTEVIVWGGVNLGENYGDGAIYDPHTDTWRGMSSTGAPAARALPAHVWTGTEMIVWGGTGAGGALGDGAAYNPTTDTWRAISAENAPSPRTWMYQSVWTGTEIIVWGGAKADLSQSYNDGARYNPSTDTWTTMSMNNVPLARNRNAMAWTGKELFVFGGAYNNIAYLNDGGRYNPLTDKWSPVSDVGGPSPRIHIHAVWTGASMLVYGGYTGSQHSPQLFSYSPYEIGGLPGSWLVEHFGPHYRHDPASLPGADPDDDGSTNLKEYTSGTAPLNPLSGFASGIQMTPTITWRSVPGVSYRILRKASLNAPAWEVIANSVEATETISMYLDFTSTSNNGFYLVEPLVAP